MNLSNVLGVLLLDESVHILRFNGRERQVRDDRNWCYHGWYDVGINTANGSHWQKNSTSLRAWWHVHLLYFHHHLFSHKGEIYYMLSSLSRAEAKKNSSGQFLICFVYLRIVNKTHCKQYNTTNDTIMKNY